MAEMGNPISNVLGRLTGSAYGSGNDPKLKAQGGGQDSAQTQPIAPEPQEHKYAGLPQYTGPSEDEDIRYEPKNVVNAEADLPSLETISAYDIPEPSLWDKVYDATIARPMQWLGRGVEQYERYVQDPIFGMITKDSESERIYNNLRDEGENWWLSWGESFDQNPNWSGTDKLLLRVVADPLNIVGWGILGKVPKVGKFLGKIDDAFMYFSEVPIKAGKGVGRGTKWVHGKIPEPVRAGLKPTAVTRAQETGKQYHKAHGATRTIINTFANDPRAFEKGGPDIMQALARKVIQYKNIAHHNVPQSMKDFNELITAAAIPSANKMKGNAGKAFRDIEDAIESALAKGEAPPRASTNSVVDEIYDILQQTSPQIGKEAKRGEAIARITQVLGGDFGIKSAQEGAERIVKGIVDRKMKLLSDTAEGMFTPRTFTHDIAAKYSTTMGEMAVAHHKQMVQGAWSSVLNRADWIESALMRKVLDDWMSKPFAQSFLSFSMYGPMNLVEEAFRSMLTVKSIGYASAEDLQQVVWDLNIRSEHLIADATLATQVSQLGIEGGTLATTEGLKLARQRAETMIRTEGILNGWSEDKIARHLEKYLKRVDDEVVPLVKLPTVGAFWSGNIGRADNKYAKIIGDAVRGVRGGKGLGYLNRIGEYPLLRFDPLGDPMKAGRFMLQPTGLIGDMFGNASILMSQKAVGIRRASWIKMFKKEFDKISVAEDVYYKQRGKFLDDVDSAIVHMMDDPIVKQSPRLHKEFLDLQKNVQTGALSPGVDLVQMFDRVVNMDRVLHNEINELMTRRALVLPDTKMRLRSMIAEGKSPDDLVEYLTKPVEGNLSQGVQDIYSQKIMEPTVMAKRLEQLKFTFTHSEIKNDNQLLAAMNNVHTTMGVASMLPHEVRQAAGHMIGKIGEKHSGTIWNVVDDQIDDLVKSIDDTIKAMSDHVDAYAKNRGVKGIEEPMNLAKTMAEETKATWRRANSERDALFARKGEFTTDQFWKEHRAMQDEIWADYGARQATTQGAAAAELTNATTKSGEGLELYRMAPGREISMEELSRMMGGTSDGLRAHMIENMACLREDGFVNYVMKYLEDTGRAKGVTKVALRRIHKQLSSERTMSKMMQDIASPIVEDTMHLASDLKALKVSNKLTDDAIVTARGHMKRLNAQVKQQQKDNPELFKNIKDMKQKAADVTEAEMRKMFVQYDEPTSLDMFMKHFFPFWTYEVARPPWLARAMTRHPWIPAQLGRYYNAVDKGYFQLSPAIQIMPLRGTIFGATATLNRPDYPAVYNGWFFEAVDAMQRYGFYPNAPLSAGLIGAGMASGGPFEAGGLLPPAHDTFINFTAATGSDVALDLQERLFPSKFRDYNLNQWLQRNHDTRLSEVEMEIKHLKTLSYDDMDEGVAEKYKGRLRELEDLKDDAYRAIAVYSFIGTQTGMTRMRDEDRVKAEEARGKMAADILPITEEEYHRLIGMGKDPFAMYSDQVSPALWSLLAESWPSEYKGVASELRSQEPDASIVKAQEELKFEMTKARESRYQAVNQAWREFVTSGEMSNTVLKDTLEEVNGDYYSQTEKLFGKKVVKDGELKWATDDITGKPLTGDYGWVTEDGEYVQGIPMTWEETKEFYEVVGRMGPLSPPHPLDIYLEHYYAVDPYERKLPDGSPDWDYFFEQREGIEQAVPDGWKPDWDEMKGRFLPEPEQKAMKLKDTFLKPYWDLWDDTLKQYSPEEQMRIQRGIHSNDPLVRDKIQDEELYKRFRRALQERRETMREYEPIVDYFLWFFGYTEKGIGGRAVPLYYNDSDHNWGKQPPGFDFPELWADSYDEGKKKRLQDYAEEIGFEWLNK